ncbi:MAG: hypothetical protein H7Y02_03175 [Candidatus Obscuribacterales bacterium]|nr:hypothetical protein [Steroidobacteraceae bacterium]
MDQAQLELQLKVWKELAITKQVLMRTATDALKLDPDCTQEELKQSIDTVIKQNRVADASVASAQEQAKQAVAVMDRKMYASAQAQAAAEAARANLLATHENAMQQMATERVVVAKELQELKERLAEKDKALKAINTALADTPENVIKKMKSLKKEKQDEADGRRQLEGTFNTLRKDKQQQDKQMTELRENTTKLVTQYRDTHALCVTLQEQLKPLLADAAALPVVPELDSKLLESIEQPATTPPKKGSGSVSVLHDRKSA